MRSLAFALALMCAPVVVRGQALGGNEYVAGAALNLALRGPYVAKTWRRPLPRFVLSQGISLAYERFVDVHGWNAPGHKPWGDLSGRLVGYAATEVLVTLARKVF